MVGETLLFLTDIELFNVVNHFLLQAVFVVVNGSNLFEIRNNALTNLLHAGCFVRFNAMEQCFDVIDFFIEFLGKCLTLLLAEGNEIGYCFIDGFFHYHPFLIRQFLDFNRSHGIGQTKHGGDEVLLWVFDIQFLANGLNLLNIICNYGTIDGSG